MRVFVSWSGELSKQVAKLLGDWIGDVLQGVEPWVSTEDIDKGSIWFGDITKQLSETGFGILCLTSENLSAPWILFEAGALSKGLDKNRVCPLLVDVAPKDLLPPLAQFNAALPTKEDMLKLIKAINNQNGPKLLTDDRVQKSFDQWWDVFEKNFKQIITDHRPAKNPLHRKMDDMVAEILELTRSMQKSMQQEKFLPGPFGLAAPSGSTTGPVFSNSGSGWVAPVWNDFLEKALSKDDAQRVRERIIMSALDSPAKTAQEKGDDDKKDKST